VEEAPRPTEGPAFGGSPPPVNPDELAKIAADVAADEAARTKREGGASPALLAQEAKEERLLGIAEEVAAGDASWLAELTAEEIGEMFQLGFGLWADRRQAAQLPYDYWELSDKSALRLARWLKRSIAMHGLAWVEKWLPDLLVAGFLYYEIQSRRRRDAEHEARTAKVTPPAPALVP
jgi:hypothetical protein